MLSRKFRRKSSRKFRKSIKSSRKSRKSSRKLKAGTREGLLSKTYQQKAKERASAYNKDAFPTSCFDCLKFQSQKQKDEEQALKDKSYAIFYKLTLEQEKQKNDAEYAELKKRFNALSIPNNKPKS